MSENDALAEAQKKIEALERRCELMEHDMRSVIDWLQTLAEQDANTLGILHRLSPDIQSDSLYHYLRTAAENNKKILIMAQGDRAMR